MDVRTGKIFNSYSDVDPEDRAYVVQMRLPPTSRQKQKMRVGRNDRCPCGSGKKFKHCCLIQTAG